ncbi:hypothetical protein HMP09_1544 [Sphingomonas sp. HMP9]|uniref:DUF3999 family protein n=1 Tax=Sphingomonas sp. HMP9 TaxID=1517554 RepID=UPI0015969D12|nr:DUF3999 family protein [Sphingomonas sp. HMP9]BCA62310.1 hypothetical protein HMP09_1544 [Sphingomonas sp. HMP9]
MSGFRWRLAARAGAVLLLAAAPAGSDGDPEGYALRFPLSVEAGARLQRLALPAAVLAGLQTRDGHDVRVFDAKGRAMPIARAAASAVVGHVSLDPMPILGGPDALKVSGVSLRLDGRGAAQVVEVRGEPVTAGGAPVLLGVLLDARRVSGRADRVVVAADLPVGQPVTLAVEASSDLRDWRRLGEATVYRRANDAARSTIVPLDGAAVAREYLRITWRAESRLLAPVGIRNAVLDVRPDGTAAFETVEAQAPAPASGNARVIDFAVPFATPIARLRVVPTQTDGVVPVRILGRDDREQPWTLLGQGVANSDGGRDIMLSGASPHAIRIEADARSAGFTGAPRLRFGFADRSLLFLTSGTAPFTVSAGRTGAKDVFLAPDDLRDRQGAAGDARLRAVATGSLKLSPLAEAGAPTRTIILWGVLLAATALLAGVAWMLWRQQRAQPRDAA